MERRSTRLIDKDDALKVLKFNSWNIDEWDKPDELRQAGLQANDMDYQSIDGLPTIEHLEIPVGKLTYNDFYRLKAIPISWIEEKIKNACDYDCYRVGIREILGWIVHEWRKENESNTNN